MEWRTGVRKVLFLLLALAAILPCCSSDEISFNNFGPADILWKLQAFQMDDGTIIEIDDPGRYTLLFNRNGTLEVRADCNTCNGEYALGSGLFRMAVYACTEAACPPDSLDIEYLRALNLVMRYVMTDGELTLIYPQGNLLFGT